MEIRLRNSPDRDTRREIELVLRFQTRKACECPPRQTQRSQLAQELINHTSRNNTINVQFRHLREVSGHQTTAAHVEVVRLRNSNRAKLLRCLLSGHVQLSEWRRCG